MAALTLHADLFAEVGAPSVLSQRVVRHALAIMHLLITEGDPADVEDTALQRSLDQRTQDKKIAIDQIMKLVLGILHLLNEGPASHEQAVNLSDEDWAHLEREQRELYSDLLTDNEQTLQSLGSFSVKTEAALGMEKVDLASKETAPSEASASSPDGRLDPYADPSRSPVSDSYHPHPFLHPLKDGSHSFPESADRSSVYGTPSSAGLGAFQRTCPDPSKEPYVTMFPDASSSYGQAYASGSTEDLAENISIIQIKQEASPTALQPQTSTEDRDVTPETTYVEQALQVLCRKHGKPSKASSGSRIHKVSKPHNVTRTYVSTQETANSGQTLKTQLSTDSNRPYWGRREANPSAKKPFQCLRCEKSFNCRSHLIMHNRVHTRERPYVCECGKTFTQSSNLFRHQRGHRHHKMQLREQNYPCPQCDKKFPDLSRLVTHQKTYHRVEGEIEGAVETYDSQMG